MREKILKCLRDIGCDYDFLSDQLLSEVIENSIMFISFIVELETEFFIQIPDEYLFIGSFKTLDDVCAMLETVMTSK